MKLAIVTAYPPSKVTLTEYAYHLVKSFRQHSEITEIILLTDRTEEGKDIAFTESGCKISVKECWTFNSYKTLWSVSSALRSIKPDAVLYNLQFMKFGDSKIQAALGLMLPTVSKWMKIPTIVLLHNIMETVDLDTAGFASNKLLKRVYTLIGKSLTRLILNADRVAVTMQSYVDILSKEYGVDHVRLIPHGTFEVAAEPTYTLPSGPLQIMAFGKFGTYKKVENLIEAVELVRKDTGMDLEIVIAGTDNPNVKGYLARVAQQYQHVSKLRFTGYVAEQDVERIFTESAVAVFPYTSTTGSSGVLHQAGSYGRAVVMPDLGDLARLVTDEGYQGEFFEPESIISLAKAIQAIVVNPRYRVSMGKQNYKAATAYPMSKITDLYVQLFNEIIQADNQSVSVDNVLAIS